MKLVLLILLISSVGICAHKRITIIDIRGKFSDNEYAEQKCEGSNSSKVNYVLKPDLKVVRVVDGIKRIWQSLHVGQDCTYCHVTNHNDRPVLVMLYIQQFNTFHSVKRYRLFHETWVPITKRFYNEIAKAINGFEGLEFDLEVDISQGFDLEKVTISKYSCKTFTNVKLTPNVGYHIDIVRHADTLLWKRTKYQEEVVEINMILENQILTYAHLVYETYYNTLDHYYFRYDKEWKKISKKYYYHKNDRPKSLIPYKFPDEVIDLSSPREPPEEIPVSEQPYDTAIIGPTGKIFETKRPVSFRRFPRPMITQEYKPNKVQKSKENDNKQKNVNLEHDVIVVLDDDDNESSTAPDPSIIAANELSKYIANQQTSEEQIPQAVLETNSSDPNFTYETPAHIDLTEETSQELQYTTEVHQPQYTTEVQESLYTTEAQQPQYTTDLEQYTEDVQQQQQYTTEVQESVYTTELQQQQYATEVHHQQYRTDFEQYTTDEQQQQYITEVEQPQYITEIHHQQYIQDIQQQPSTSSQVQTSNQCYVWYGNDDSSTSGDQQVYTWYGGEQTITTSQTTPQYSYSYIQTPSTSSQEQNKTQDKDVSQQQSSSSSQSHYEPIIWYQVESESEGYQQYQSSSSNYKYEPATTGVSLKDSIYPYQEPSKETSKETSKDKTQSDSSKTQSSSDKSDKISSRRIRRKSNEASRQGDEWLWYKRPQTKNSDQPPLKKQILSYKKDGGKKKEISISKSDFILIPDDLSLEEVPKQYSDLMGKNDCQLERELAFFESYYLDFEEEDSYSKRHQKRRGDRGYFFEKISNFEVKGKTGVDIDLFELDDANPNYIIEVQSYYSVPIFKIIPAENKFFKEVNAGNLIVWKNQDRGLCLVLKAVMINGNFGAMEAIVKRYGNKCFLHYIYDRDYYRSIHAPTYINTISCYALELHEEAMTVAKEEAEKIARRQKEAAIKAGLDEKEIAVREYVKMTGGNIRDLRAKGRPKRKYAERRRSEEAVIVIEAEPLCQTSRKERITKKKKVYVESEHEDDDDDYDDDD